MHHMNYPQVMKTNINNVDVDIYVVPVLRNQKHFMFCNEHIHITLLGKILSILYLIIHCIFIRLIMIFGNEVSVMIMSLIGFSVSIAHIYGSFRWRRACLIPIIILLSFYIVHQIVCLLFLLYIFLNENAYFHQQLHSHLNEWEISSIHYVFQAILLVIIPFLLLCIGALKIIVYQYQFLTYVDRLLKRFSLRQEKCNDNNSSGESPPNFDKSISSKKLEPIQDVEV
uniref:G_PROTEIN_RECEP_F1_2 domain-containing protein n=1 Tax=Parastrongyloides trichosuri TaxID=131310 RepID=A0A0N4ZQI6_PARTI